MKRKLLHSCPQNNLIHAKSFYEYNSYFYRRSNIRVNICEMIRNFLMICIKPLLLLMNRCIFKRKYTANTRTYVYISFITL